MVLVIAERLTYFLVCDKGACWVPGCFCAALELAMSEWRLANPHGGGRSWGCYALVCLILRFLQMTSIFFANTKEEVQNLLDSLVRHLATAGSVLNTSTEAQPPSFIQVGDSHMIKVLGYSEIAQMAWLHAERFPWSGLRCGIPFCKQAAKAFQKTPLDVRMQGLFLSNIDCGISKQLFLQQLVFACRAPTIIQKTFGEVWRSVFENLFVALWGLHRPQIGQHNGMIFCMSGNMRVDHWSPRQWNFFLVKEMHDSILEFRFLHCKIYLPNAGWGGHLHGNHIQTYSSAWTPATNLGTRNWKCFCRYKALGNWEIVARNAARWDSLLPCFLDFCSM